jgi:hypothetical protein
VPRAQVYDITMYLLCALLVLGLLCNRLVRPVDERHFMTDAELKAETRLAREEGVGTAAASDPRPGDGLVAVKLWLAWLAVGIPLTWGLWMTLAKAIVLFR